MGHWERMDEIIDRTEQTVLVISLSFMILIAFSQIVLRNLFDTGLAWGDPLVRNLVLWVSFIGAALATKEGKHINIDVVSRWIPSRGKILVEAITGLFSSFICALLTFAALKFINNEAQMGGVTFLGIPLWIPEIILPIIFGLMVFRCSLHSLKNFSMTMGVNPTHTQGEKQ
jgi:TRAP-type C4-dicarboxylate transport system permease small subunit